ncbi:MAG: DUF1670 domain-containing protein [Bacillota bacterium]
MPGKRNQMYDSFLGKNLANSQKYRLSQKFKFSFEDWLAERIINMFNQKMKEWEQKHNIKRLKPGELLTSYQNQKLILPLIKPEWIKRLTSGTTWANLRDEIEKEHLVILKDINPEASLQDVRCLINQRSLLPKMDGFRWKNFKQPENLGDNPSVHKHYSSKIKEDPEVPIEVLEKLIDYLTEAENISRPRAQAIIECLNQERNKFCPLHSELEVGQMAWIGMDSAKFSPFHKKSKKRHQIPVKLTLYTPDEIEEAKNINSLNELNAFNLKRLERVCFEAYHQGAILNTVGLGLMFFLQPLTVSKLNRKYMELTELILPTAGTIKDCGRATTHKHIIIDKHLQGMLNQEISQATYHDGESIDRYIDTFQGVLILYIYDLPDELKAKVLNTSPGVIKEHIEIIESYFDDRKEILSYLKKQGVSVP